MAAVVDDLECGLMWKKLAFSPEPFVSFWFCWLKNDDDGRWHDPTIRGFRFIRIRATCLQIMEMDETVTDRPNVRVTSRRDGGWTSSFFIPLPHNHNNFPQQGVDYHQNGIKYSILLLFHTCVSHFFFNPRYLCRSRRANALCFHKI